jgi:hypothetical protein
MAGQWQSFKLASAGVNPFSGANKSSDFSATVAMFPLRQISGLQRRVGAKVRDDLLAARHPPFLEAASISGIHGPPGPSENGVANRLTWTVADSKISLPYR